MDLIPSDLFSAKFDLIFDWLFEEETEEVKIPFFFPGTWIFTGGWTSRIGVSFTGR